MNTRATPEPQPEDPPEDTGLEGQIGDDHFHGGDLCPACLAELSAGCGFCAKCGAPVTPTVAISPFERISAEGYIYRQAVAAPRKPIILIGIWLMFLPVFLSGVLMLARHLWVRELPLEHVVLAFFGTLIGGLGLFHVTRNYLRRSRSSTEEASGQS